MQAWGGHGGTTIHTATHFGAPLACAAALATLDAIEHDRLAERARDVGARWIDALRAARPRGVREVRGRGLLIGVELRPDAGGARRFCEALQREGILAKETHVDTIRFAPPLIVTRDDIDWAMERIAPVLRMP
jgi:ornithine--oxo-acid transaminase